MTLNEAGTWAVCHSKAWNDNKLFPAFWVWGSQVSKTPESGEYLVTGSFIIRGKKTYLNPPKLELGYTVLFVLDDISILNHKNEWRLRGANEDGEMELLRNTSETLDEEAFDEDDDDEKDANKDGEIQPTNDDLNVAESE